MDITWSLRMITNNQLSILQIDDPAHQLYDVAIVRTADRMIFYKDLILQKQEGKA